MGDMIEAYKAFLRSKVVMADSIGFDIDDSEINPILKPFQRACVRWAVRMGRAALFESFGLGKTLQQIEIVRLILERLLSTTNVDGMALIVIPLGVRQEFLRDAVLLSTGDHPAITDEQRAELKRWQAGRPDRIPRLKFIRRIEECDGPGIYLTNYETVRDGKLDPRNFIVGSLDEAAILRGFGGTRTFREFMATFAGDRKTMNDRVLTDGVKYRFVATATPSPNEYIELLAYSAFLGVMDIGNAKTRFFKRNSEKADQLTIHPHKEREFWMWVASWGLFVQKPSDLGFSDDGYELPEMEIHWHEIPADHTDAGFDFRGQGQLIKQQAIGVVDSAREKRESLSVRIGKLMEIVDGYRSQTCLSEGISREEQGAAVGASEPARKSQLPGEQSQVSGEVETLAGSQPGTHTGVAAGASGAESRKDQCTQPGLVQREQGTSSGADQDKEDQALRSDAGSVSGDAAPAGREMCDLRNGQAVKKGNGKFPDRSQPQDGKGQGSALHEVQFRSGDVRRQPGSAPQCDGLPDQIVIWCDLNDEQRAIERALKASHVSCSSLFGSQDLEEREGLIAKWRAKETTAFVSKPMMYGAGINLQQCHTMIFAGIGFKAAEFLQAIHRIHRFLQKQRCVIHMIYTEQEREVRRILEQKWQQHKDTVEQMTAIIKEFGLSSAAMADNLKRAMGVERIEVIGRNFRAINNDCVLEAANMPDNSIDLGLTSIPFSTQYEYSPNYSDFGHSDNNAHFFEQMDFLTPNLLRILKPGRIFAIHVKDRIVPGGMTGLGFQTVYPFHARCIEHYTKHGFGYLGMKTIVTDVVRENNQTYRLGWSEQCKDGTKMGVGMPEYLLLFRKPPSDTSNSYADEPVTKGKPDCADADGNVIPWVRGGNEVIGTGYSRARWQVDAHGFARSSGNRLLTPDELETLDHDIIFRWFRDYHLHNIYDFEHHVRIGETIDSFHRLPTTFMLLQPPSWMDDVWTDIARMRTLNMMQSQKGQEQHLCLARGSLVLTRDGYVPIEDVASGDEVLTHRGRWRKVLAARMTGKDREVVDLRAQGVAGLRLTPDHKLWARLAHGARAVDAATKSEPEWLPAEDSVGHYINIKLPPVEPSVLTKTECWLIGRWIADGHVGTRGDYWVSIGPDKLAAFEQHAGEHAGTRSVGTAVQIRLKSLSETMRSTLARCGRGASGKLIPAELLGLDGTLAQSVLAGYLSGDGHFIQSRRRWQASSVSRSLLLGISLLVQRVHGTVASIAPGRPSGQAVIQGRTVNTKQEWMLSFDDGSNEGRKRPFVLDDGAWKRVRSADSAGTSDVWCLKVEEDESFTAEGCIVKNCPLPFDIVDRVIEQFSMPGETVFDPFGGIMSVPFRAIKKGRKAIACELSSRYFMDGVQYCQAAEREMSMPSLFDSLEMPEAA